MTSPALFFASLAALGAIAALLQPAPARADVPTKIWVHNAGADSVTCGAVTTPCKTFQRAHDNVAIGGEIGVLAPGDYGPVAISKSVNLTNDGTGEAGILVAATGVNINAGVGDIISLRGLVIDGQNGGAVGVQIQQTSATHIQNCVIRNLQAPGVGILANAKSNMQLFVSDTIIFNNGSTATTGGMWIEPFGTVGVDVVLDRVHLENNVFGLRVDGLAGTGNGAHVIIRDSVVSGNFGDGILAVTATGDAPAFLIVERTSVVDNAATGLLANGRRATMLLHDSTIARNGTGINAVAGGQLVSYGNNRINNNLGPDGTPTFLLTLN